MMDEPNAARGPAGDPPRDGDPLLRIVRNTAGILLLLGGVLGLFLPILQVVLMVVMVVVGLALIDLAIKGRAHEWLLRYGWYRSLARVHEQLLASWHAKYEERRRRRSAGEDPDRS